MTTYYQGNKKGVRDVIINVVKAVTGEASADVEAARTLHTAIGLAALSDIKDDFVRKAKGGVGEDGEKWPPLSREYLAYGRRFGSGEQAALKKSAGLTSANRHRGLLTAAQDKRWRAIFVSQLKRWSASLSLTEAKARAAKTAWTVLKREGAKTKLEVFGNRQVDILRDTGVLLNSLSPGVIDTSGGEYQAPAEQIFDLTGSGVIVGTNVKYAKAHNRGIGKMPKRQFLPIDGVPRVWTDRWSRVAAQVAAQLIRQRIGGAQ